jgi:hypothetical protein
MSICATKNFLGLADFRPGGVKLPCGPSHGSFWLKNPQKLNHIRRLRDWVLRNIFYSPWTRIYHLNLHRDLSLLYICIYLYISVYASCEYHFKIVQLQKGCRRTRSRILLLVQPWSSQLIAWWRSRKIYPRLSAIHQELSFDSNPFEKLLMQQIHKAKLKKCFRNKIKLFSKVTIFYQTFLKALSLEIFISFFSIKNLPCFLILILNSILNSYLKTALNKASNSQKNLEF